MILIFIYINRVHALLKIVNIKYFSRPQRNHGRLYFQGLFKKVCHIQVYFKPVRNLTVTLFFIHVMYPYLGLNMTKPVFGVSDKGRLKQVTSATETSYKIEILFVASLNMIPSKNKGADQSAQAGLHLCCLRTPNTGFLASRYIYYNEIALN